MTFKSLLSLSCFLPSRPGLDGPVLDDEAPGGLRRPAAPAQGGRAQELGLHRQAVGRPRQAGGGAKAGPGREEGQGPEHCYEFVMCIYMLILEVRPLRIWPFFAGEHARRKLTAKFNENWRHFDFLFLVSELFELLAIYICRSQPHPIKWIFKMLSEQNS